MIASPLEFYFLFPYQHHSLMGLNNLRWKDSPLLVHWTSLIIKLKSWFICSEKLHLSLSCSWTSQFICSPTCHWKVCPQPTYSELGRKMWRLYSKQWPENMNNIILHRLVVFKLLYSCGWFLSPFFFSCIEWSIYIIKPTQFDSSEAFSRLSEQLLIKRKIF